MKLTSRKIQISCDGGAATGKTTGAKLISKKYNLKFLSSGLLYRYAAKLILEHAPKNKIKFLDSKFKKLNHLHLNKINLNTQEISIFSSKIAKLREVRKILKKYQINFSKKNKNCCIEGRDISTKILPKSDVKFFFICNLDIAAKRRFKELKKKESEIKFSEIKKALRMRNISDIRRKNSPLLKHRDSIEIDTGKLSKKAMIAKMSKFIDKIIKNKHDNRTRN